MFIRLPTAHTSPADLATELEESVQTNASIIQETAKRAIESQRRHFAKHLSKQRASSKEIWIMSEEETSKEPKPNFTTPVASLVKATLTDAFRQHAVFATTDVTSISRQNAAIKKAIDEVTTANEQQLNAEATFEDFSAMSDTLYTVGHKLAQDFTNIAWEEAGFKSSMSMEDAKKRVAAEKLKAVIKQLANPPNMADPVLVRADNDSKMLKLHAAATEALVPWDAEQFRALVKQHGPQTSIYTTVLLGKTPAELGANFEDGAKWAHGWRDQMSNMATMAQFTSKQQTQRTSAAPTTVTAIALQQSRPSPTATAAPIKTTSKCGRCRQAGHATTVCPTQGCQICNA